MKVSTRLHAHRFSIVQNSGIGWRTRESRNNATIAYCPCHGLSVVRFSEAHISLRLSSNASVVPAEPGVKLLVRVVARAGVELESGAGVARAARNVGTEVVRLTVVQDPQARVCDVPVLARRTVAALNAQLGAGARVVARIEAEVGARNLDLRAGLDAVRPLLARGGVAGRAGVSSGTTQTSGHKKGALDLHNDLTVAPLTATATPLGLDTHVVQRRTVGIEDPDRGGLEVSIVLGVLGRLGRHPDASGGVGNARRRGREAAGRRTRGDGRCGAVAVAMTALAASNLGRERKPGGGKKGGQDGEHDDVC